MRRRARLVNLSSRPHNERMAPRPDVLIIGGGIIGLTCAERLAAAGLRVALYERGELAKEASWAGAGIIPPGNPERAANAYDRLRARSSAGFAEYAAYLRNGTGIDTGYRVSGGIEYLQPGDDDLPRRWGEEGLPFQRLPGGGYFFPTFAQLRNPWHLRALIAACDPKVELHRESPVIGWSNDGVRLASGEVRTAGAYLVCAGAWAAELLASRGWTLPVWPVRGQIVLFRESSPSFENILLCGHRYVVPRGDGYVLVGSTEEPEAGFAKATTPEGIADLVAFARKMVPALRDARIEKSWAGLRPGSADGMPFIGPVPGTRNVYAAVGHYRAGVQLSLGTANLVRAMLTGGDSDAAFRLDRDTSVRVNPAFRS